MKHLFALLIVAMLLQSLQILAGSTLLRAYARTGSHDNLAMAATVDPSNPAIALQLAESLPSISRRIIAARELVDREPLIGEGWAKLFVLKLAAREVDDEMTQALAQAVSLAPFDPVVQERLFVVGMDSWLVIAPSGRRQLVEIALQMMEGRAEHRREQRRQLVLSSGLMPLLCLRLPDLETCSSA